MIVEQITWLSKEAREAQITVRGDGVTALVFCHPCKLSVGARINEPLHAFGASAIQISRSQEERIENQKGLTHFVQGKVVKYETPTVSAKGFLIQIEDYFPGGIRQGDYISFECARLDAW